MPLARSARTLAASPLRYPASFLLLVLSACGLARGELGPFAYGLMAVTLSGLLVAIPLSGELARLLVERREGERERRLPRPGGAGDDPQGRFSAVRSVGRVHPN